MVMAAKGITYDLISVDTANPPEDLLMLAPHYHSVPTLVERDNAIYISNVISEYLDERYPHPALMPAEPIFRAMHRIAVRQVEQDWVPQVQAIMAGGKNVEPARKRLKELILESLPFFKSNKFFFGNEMSLVDCAITPIIWRLPALGIQLPKDAKCVEDYGLRIFRNPAFMRSMTPEEKVLRDLAFS
jgi:RNA polymerase-associated protein